MGVPVVTLSGDRHAARVGATLLGTAGLPELIANTPEQFVEIAANLASDHERRQSMRASMRSRLSASPLCDGSTMGSALGDALRAMWQGYCASRSGAVVVAEEVDAKPDEELIRLHIGGRQVKEGWKILNIAEGEGVDFVGDVCNLGGFADCSCSDIYASHVLEHVAIGDALPVFNELYRLLVPGGKLYISVPDLETVCWLFCSPTINAAAKFGLMRVIYGGQSDKHDFHHIGFTFDFMVDMLRDAGFHSVEHVESLGHFSDTSELVLLGQRISLNLIATK